VGADARLTADPDVVDAADAVVLPGVGAFGRCMEALHRSGLEAPARRAIEGSVPFLGICVGLQMLYEGSEEDPDVAGMGVLEGRVRRLAEGVKRPQMQWNQVEQEAGSPMFAGLDDPAWVYFVHSYAPEPSDDVVATCDYGGPVVAAVARGSLWGTQFHPEKSSTAGLRLLANFVASAAAA
jgi:glutamine amidotransferase